MKRCAISCYGIDDPVGTAGLAGAFTLTSPQVKDGDRLTQDRFFRASAARARTSPGLGMERRAEGCQELAVTVYDPDARRAAAGGTG